MPTFYNFIAMEWILYIGLSQSFFAGLMIAIKRPKQLSDRILAAWLFLISIEMLISLINKNFIEISAFAVIPFTYGPLMYYYVIYLTKENRKFNHHFWVHFIPFAVFFILSVIYRDEPVINMHRFFKTDSYITLRMIYSFSFFVSITTYSIVVFVLIDKHQKNIKNLFSYTSEKITLSWLKFVSICFYITYVLMFSGGGIRIFVKNLTYDPIEFSYFGLTFFAFAFSFYGYHQAEIIHNKNGEEEKKEHRYERSGLKEKDAERFLEKLIAYMEREKPYLNGDLTIHDVAEKIKIPRHYITQIINEKLNKNFYTFINEYRINEIKKMISSKEFDHLTLIAIAYDSGFNSKSAFHSAFKSITKMTPLEYKMHINKEVK